jgi:hypothetical protein
MKNKTSLAAGQAGLLFASAAVTALAMVAGIPFASAQPNGIQGVQPVVIQQPAGMNQDAYDYFPGYETYYNRTSHEFVYRDGTQWVRRPAPREVSREVMLAAPSVRMDFHDSPEFHHDSVIKNYPKGWAPPGKDQNGRK